MVLRVVQESCHWVYVVEMVVNQTHRGGRHRVFEEFVKLVEPGLRAALVARYGPEVGREAAAEALAWAWENWERLDEMENPAGYLYRVGQSKSRRFRLRRTTFPAPPIDEMHSGTTWVEPELPRALQQLSQNQRIAVVLVHGYGLTHREVADLLGLSRSTVQNHVERGLLKLQAMLGDKYA